MCEIAADINYKCVGVKVRFLNPTDTALTTAFFCFLFQWRHRRSQDNRVLAGKIAHRDSRCRREELPRLL